MGGYVMVRMRMRRNLYNFVKDCESVTRAQAMPGHGPPAPASPPTARPPAPLCLWSLRQVLGFCGYDFGARNLAGGLKAGRGFIKPKPLSAAEVARIERQSGMAPAVPEAEFGVPAGAAAAARAMLREQAEEAERASAEGAGEAAAAEGGAEAAPSAPPAPAAAPVELELAFGVGDMVRVLKGPFRNLEGPVAAIAPADGSGALSVRVELSLMGQATQVEIDARALASVLQ